MRFKSGCAGTFDNASQEKSTLDVELAAAAGDRGRGPSFPCLEKKLRKNKRFICSSTDQSPAGPQYFPRLVSGTQNSNLLTHPQLSHPWAGLAFVSVTTNGSLSFLCNTEWLLLLPAKASPSTHPMKEPYSANSLHSPPCFRSHSRLHTASH